jgi:transcriptional regulator with XRE-family HTH domain
MIRAEQCRAARGLLNWSQPELASRAGVGLSTVRNLEAARHQTTKANGAAIRRALEEAGVEFIASNGGGPGVRLRDNPELAVAAAQEST